MWVVRADQELGTQDLLQGCSRCDFCRHWKKNAGGRLQNLSHRYGKREHCPLVNKITILIVWSPLQEKPVGESLSIINLQGKLDCKYVVGFFFSPKPQRANLRERWPVSVEDNLKRLEEAGLPYDRQIPKCSNCGGKG